MKFSPPLNWEICILAGGLSRRMGRDKSRLKLGARTLLGHIRAEARMLGWPVRVIRRDAVPRCGPLGGVFTALKTTHAPAVLFLACDMPWITAALLRAVTQRFEKDRCGLFVRSERGAGFPFALGRAALPVVAGQIARGDFSLQLLARALKARAFRPPVPLRLRLSNVNTPAEWRRAVRAWRRRN